MITLPDRPARRDESIPLPAWIDPARTSDAAALAARPTISGDEGIPLRLVTTAIPAARALGASDLRAAVARTYADVRAIGAGCGLPHAVRFWNFIPGMHDPMGSGLTRYMVFNAGRFDALVAWYGGLEAMEHSVATASGIGHDGDDLFVSCLFAHQPGRGVENPRQTAAYRYSEKYGPLPPCFARATVIPHRDRSALLIGGTASVRGQDSVHSTREAQLDETCTNLDALIQRAGGRGLADLNSVRAYALRADDTVWIGAELAARIPHARDVEIVQATICREDLLLEIEGVADLGRCNDAPARA